MPAKKKTAAKVPEKLTIGSRKKSAPQTKTKRSVVVHKSNRPVSDLYQVLAKIEETIQELSRILAETETSSHRDIRGQPRLTPRQLIIQKQLELANRRADRVLNLLANG